MEVYDVNEVVTVRVPMSGVVKPFKDLTLTTGNRRLLDVKWDDVVDCGSYCEVKVDGRKVGPGVLGYAVIDSVGLWFAGYLDVEFRRSGTWGRGGGGGGIGTSDYGQLRNKPRVNGVELSGDKSSEELNIIEVRD